jgi:hypothetical protein
METQAYDAESGAKSALWDYILGLSPNNPQYALRVIKGGRNSLYVDARNGKSFRISVKEIQR